MILLKTINIRNYHNFKEGICMKRNKENVFLIIFIMFQALLFGVMILFAVTLTNRASASSKEVLSHHALKVSEENMKERVDNIINLIEQEQKNALELI